MQRILTKGLKTECAGFTNRKLCGSRRHDCVHWVKIKKATVTALMRKSLSEHRQPELSALSASSIRATALSASPAPRPRAVN